MAIGLKTKGMEQLRDLRRRVNRQYGMERISRTDWTNLIDMIDKLEAYIVKMDEKSPELGEYDALW